MNRLFLIMGLMVHLDTIWGSLFTTIVQENEVTINNNRISEYTLTKMNEPKYSHTL